ncbi:hypothetical protein [Nocardia sp. NPDC057030]|uniref:hypothetical protein n=1 Tax=unclassified Nocardia TaxID=2637762 RepID=UPI0036419EBD
MSERSVEDELISEARTFASAMSATLRRYSQAANWLEKRKVRKEITQAWRAQMRQAELDRAHQLSWTANSVETFRAHSLAVARRANDPSVDHDRRYRDVQALSRHRNEMAERVLHNPHLTPVEQGIALDGLDSATVFPEFANKGLFDRAHRVKGREALRYRAQVARARQTAGIERPAVEPMRHVDRAEQLSTTARADRVVSGDPDRSGQGPRRDGNEQHQTPADAADTGRFRAVVGWTDRNGVTSTRSQSFGSELDATAWMRSNPGTMLTFGVTAHAQTWDNRDDRAPLYSHSGEHRAVMASLAARENALAREHETVRNDQQREADTAPTRAEYDALNRKTEDLSTRYQQVDTERRTAVDDLSALRADHAKLTTQIGQLTTERDAAVALAGKRTQERDEAVAKVIAMTPPEQRIGTPRTDRSGPLLSVKRPAMADAPGNGAHRPDIGDGFDR